MFFCGCKASCGLDFGCSLFHTSQISGIEKDNSRASPQTNWKSHWTKGRLSETQRRLKSLKWFWNFTIKETVHTVTVLYSPKNKVHDHRESRYWSVYKQLYVWAYCIISRRVQSNIQCSPNCLGVLITFLAQKHSVHESMQYQVALMRTSVSVP